MKSKKVTPYTPPELEIIMLESNDILNTSSIVPSPDSGSSSGPADDPNIDNNW